MKSITNNKANYYPRDFTAQKEKVPLTMNHSSDNEQLTLNWTYCKWLSAVRVMSILCYKQND